MNEAEIAAKVAEETQVVFTALKHLAVFAVVGAAVGVGQMLLEDQKPTKRGIIGRALTSAGLGMCAAGVLAWIPDLPFVAQCGLAALLASLGTSGLTVMFQKFINRG